MDCWLDKAGCDQSFRRPPAFLQLSTAPRQAKYPSEENLFLTKFLNGECRKHAMNDFYQKRIKRKKKKRMEKQISSSLGANLRDC